MESIRYSDREYVVINGADDAYSHVQKVSKDMHHCMDAECVQVIEVLNNGRLKITLNAYTLESTA